MTLKEAYNKVLSDESFKDSFAESAKTVETLAEWLKEKEIDATVDDVRSFLAERSKVSGELPDDELEAVAGGKGGKNNNNENSKQISTPWEVINYC